MFCLIKILPGNHISNILKIKLQQSIGVLFKGQQFLNKQSLLKSLFYLYTIHTSIATLTMPMWVGEVHI